MSTEAGRPRNPHVPLPPVAPPRPTVPPRPRTAPPPSGEPPRGGTDGGAAPIPEDEPTRRVGPPRTAKSAPPKPAPTVPPRTAPAKSAPAKPSPAKPASARPAPPVEPAPVQTPAPSAGPPPPRPAHPPRPAATPRPASAPPATPPRFDDDIAGPPTFRLRPIRDEEPRRPPMRTVAAAACLVLGVGLLGGTAAGTLLTDDAEAGPTAAQAAFDEARGLWHNAPVDALFPRTVKGERAGPGGADRRWTRLAVAPDGPCRHAFDELLAKVLSPVGCRRLVRATYADETSTSVVTVGLVFTESDRTGMSRLRARFEEEGLGERTDLMPRTFAPRGTVAADFGDAQRASWTVRVLTRAPVIVYAVSGFADGRPVTEPRPAADAVDPEATSAPAQAGLGHDAKGLADRVEQALRTRLPEPVKEED